VALSWNASTGATAYNLQRSTVNGSGYANVVTQAGTSYTNTGLTNGTTYYYVVSATNAGGTSANSTQASATPVAPPAAPTGLTATAGDTQVSLSWTASSGATSYNVLRSTVNGSGYATVSSPTTTSYTNTGLTDGTTYYFVVTATNAGGTSGNSNQASATPAASGGTTTLGDTDDRDSQSDNAQGTNPTISASQYDDAYFKFSLSSISGTVTNAKLRVYRSDINQGSITMTVYHTQNDTWVQSGTVPGLGTSILAVTNGAIGYVEWDVTSYVQGQMSGDKIASFGMDTSSSSYTNLSTRENASNQPQLVITTSGVTIPSAPTGVTATGGNAQAALSWTASSGATSYNVKRSTVSGSGYATVSSPTTTSYTNTGLTNGTTYYYVVTAVNSAGESGNSSQVIATPGAGTSVKINAGGPAVSPFVADVDFSGGTTATNYTGTIDTSAVTSPAPQAVYQPERYGAMTYTIPGFPSGTSHTVRLHMCENYFTASGSRVFNVSINGTQVLTNFDIYATAGAAHKANIQQFTATANSSGQYVIVFTNVTNNALVNGIEVN
jgi:fibronectin type 3 domain-containing protein